MSEQKQHYFSSRMGLILSVLGIAVGTGNIWRFPRIAAQEGSAGGAGAFVFAWLCYLFLFSVPLIIAEYGIGRNWRNGVIGSFTQMIGKKYAWMGSFIAFVTTAIMFYYSVVSGWCLYYLIQSISSELPANLEHAEAIWYGFQGTAWPSVFHALMMVACGFIIIKGVSSIERINKILIPSLFCVMVISLIRAVTLPGSFEGVEYLFTADWSTLGDPSLWIEALTQSAWDTGAAWGLILTYAIYMRMKDDITISALQTGIGDSIISLIAAATIFATVFGTFGSRMSNAEIVTIMQSSGPAGTGLAFMWMPQLFFAMPGGRIFAILFFLGLTFAAFSSLIAMVELSVRVLVDMGINRNKATVGICVTGFLLGLPSAISTQVLVNQDTVWGIGLLISGAFMSFAIIKFNPTNFRTTIVNVEQRTYTLGKWWDAAIKYVVPIEVITLVIWWIYQSASVEGWYNPISTFSLATVLVQWGIALALFLFYNRKIADKTARQG